MKYKLLITDLDGTLLSTDKTVSKKNLQAIHKLIKAGKHVAVGSGRQYVDAYKFAKKIGCENEYNIANGGCTVFKGHTQYIVKYFDKEKYENMVNILRDKNIPFIVTTGDSQDVFYEGTNEFEVECRRLNPDTSLKFIKKDVMTLKHPFKISSSYTNVDELFLHKEMERRDSKLKADIAGEYFVDLIPKGVSKWTGTLKLAEELGISTDEIIAVGDQENDYDIVKNVGLGIAVKNASNKLKSVADVILDYTNDQDAIYHIIHDYML